MHNIKYLSILSVLSKVTTLYSNQIKVVFSVSNMLLCVILYIILEIDYCNLNKCYFNIKNAESSKT